MTISANPHLRVVQARGPVGFVPAKQAPVSFVPAKALSSDELLLQNWLLPPARPVGIEAWVQRISRASGPALLVAAAGGLAWLAASVF